MNQYCSSETQTIHCDPILITRAEHRRRPLLLSERLCFDAWFIWMEWFNRAWTGSCELSPIAGSVCEELIVPNISLLKFYPHVMQFLCSFVLVYFVLTEWSRTLNRCQCTCHILCHEHSVPGPSSERQTVQASPEDCILPTFMTSVSLGVPERGRAMWTRYLSEEGSWNCYSDLITMTKIPDQKKLEEEFMLVSSLRDTVHHGEKNMAAEAWSIWPLFIHNWGDGSNTFWCLV